MSRNGSGGVSTTTVDLSGMPLAELREERMAARRALELAQLRMRQTADSPQEELEELRARVAVLTEELIARYAADLSRVDSLLDPPAPRKDGAR